MALKAISLFLGWSIVAASAGAAHANCSVATLTGRYIFAGQGIIEPLEPGVQRVHYGAFTFDGHGQLSGKQSSSRGGKIGREVLGGHLSARRRLLRHHDVPVRRQTGQRNALGIYVTEDGKTGHMVRMDDGAMAVRTFQR